MCALSRSRKTEIVEKYRSIFNDSKMLLLSEFSGSKMSDLTSVREELRQKSASFAVIKNRLFKIALKGTKFEKLSEHLKGPLALVSSSTDMVSAPKVMDHYFDDDEKKFKLRIAIDGETGELLFEKEVKTLARLPSREVLVAQVMGSMMAPMQNLVNVLSATAKNLVFTVSQVENKKKESSD